MALANPEHFGSAPDISNIGPINDADVLPVFTPDNLEHLKRLGIAGIGVVHALIEAPGPEARVLLFRHSQQNGLWGLLSETARITPDGALEDLQQTSARCFWEELGIGEVAELGLGVAESGGWGLLPVLRHPNTCEWYLGVVVALSAPSLDTVTRAATLPSAEIDGCRAMAMADVMRTDPSRLRPFVRDSLRLIAEQGLLPLGLTVLYDPGTVSAQTVGEDLRLAV